MIIQLTKRASAVFLVVVLLCTTQVAIAANQTFTNVKYVLSTGGKGKEVKAHLVLTDESVEVREYRAGGTLKKITYADLTAATYSKSKHPRWKTTAALAAVVGVFALPLLFTNAKKHWLTFQAEGDYLALRLDKKNYALIIAAVEGKTGLNVERIVE